MNEDLFQELLASVREGGAILRGEKPPSRSFPSGVPDVRRIRARYKLTQAEFASLLGVHVRTLRAWESGQQHPRGTARVLLQVAAQHPDAFWDVVQPVAPGAD